MAGSHRRWGSRPAFKPADRGKEAGPGATGIAAEPYINKAEVARRLGRTVRAVEKLMRQGRLPFYRFDWQIAFRWSEVQAHFAATYRAGGRGSDRTTRQQDNGT